METQATTFKRLLVAENCKADDLRRERDALRSQLAEAVALLRSSAWRLACESRNDLAVKNDRLQARNIESFLSRLSGGKMTR